MSLGLFLEVETGDLLGGTAGFSSLRPPPSRTYPRAVGQVFSLLVTLRNPLRGLTHVTPSHQEQVRNSLSLGTLASNSALGNAIRTQHRGLQVCRLTPRRC